MEDLKKAVALTQRSKVPPLLHQRVEEGEAKEQLLPDGLLAGAVEEGGVRDGVAQVGAQQVGAQPLGRLVSHLQAVLQDADRELVRWVARQPQPGGTEETRTFFSTSSAVCCCCCCELLPEAGVGVIRDDGLFADHFQLGHPTGGQVAVLQHHPGAFLDGLVNHSGGDGPLALSQRDGLRLATPHLQVISELQ